jgi:hypothetical protein
MSQGRDILKAAPSAPPRDFPPSNDPQFQGFGGETTSIQLRLRSDSLTELGMLPSSLEADFTIDFAKVL